MNMYVGVSDRGRQATSALVKIMPNVNSSNKNILMSPGWSADTILICKLSADWSLHPLNRCTSLSNSIPSQLCGIFFLVRLSSLIHLVLPCPDKYNKTHNILT